MRVGVDGRSLVGPSGRGVANYTRSLLTALVSAYPDDEWHVLVPAGRTAPLIAGIHLSSLPLPSRVLYGLAGVSGWPRLDKLLGGVDVFWAPAPAPLALSRQVPFVLTVHDLAWELRPADFTHYERLWHRIARPRRLGRRAARVITDSEPTRDRTIERWKLTPERVITVAPGVHAPEQGPAPEAVRSVRRRYALPARYFLWVGALEPRKAPDVLARAFNRARTAGLDSALVVVGEGRLQAGLSAPGMHLLGRVSEAELESLYAGALALVMPSRLEGFGLPPLEAALHGIPSIVTDLPIFRATLGDAALRIPVDDEAALAAALTELAEDPVLRSHLGARAQAMAARFTPERSAQAVHAVLSAAAGTR